MTYWKEDSLFKKGERFSPFEGESPIFVYFLIDRCCICTNGCNKSPPSALKKFKQQLIAIKTMWLNFVIKVKI
jgi:hypothetical protein